MVVDGEEVILEINLLENGIDFILKGIDELFDARHSLRGYTDPVSIADKSYKYGILHLFSGFLLLLKERLSRHIPELIFKGKLSDVKDKLQKGKTPNTVDLDEAIERLEIGPRVEFSPNELKTIRGMQKYRNQFEHYKVEANKYQLWATITDFLGIIDRFLAEELQVNIEDSAGSFELSQKIQSIESVWERIVRQSKKEWKENILTRLEEVKSARANVLDELDAEYFNSEGKVVPFIYCPECGEKTLIAHGEYAGICVNEECLCVHPITDCDRCGEKMIGFSIETNLCESCIAWIGYQ